MRVTIVRQDGVVGVDGEFFKINLDTLDPMLHAVQWSGAEGHEEWIDKDNTVISSLEPYQPILDAWQVAKAALLASLVELVKTPAEIKAEVWLQIKAERALRQEGGFKVEVEIGVNKWIHSDQTSRVQQLGLKMAGGDVPEIPWKTMDGTFTTMSPAVATGIFQAAFTLDAALYVVAETHKATMEASDDPANYDYSTGWPERYEL